MTGPVYVTAIAERSCRYLDGIRCEPPMMEENSYRLMKKIAGRTSFTFPKFSSPGVAAYYQFCDAIMKGDRRAAAALLREVREYSIPSREELPDAEKWGHAAVQMPNDWGPVGENKGKLRAIATARARGRVLEAMCGFTSYIDDSPEITHVVALDFCREALELYDMPERTRILYDLERAVKGERMDFFDDGSFQTVGVFFGIDYLTSPVMVLREFHRILSADGTLLIVGGTTQGYPDLLKRYFDPRACSRFMRAAGFIAHATQLRDIRVDTELGRYFLVEGRKQNKAPF